MSESRAETSTGRLWKLPLFLSFVWLELAAKCCKSDAEDVNESLMWIYRLFPGFCLGHGLFEFFVWQQGGLMSLHDMVMDFKLTCQISLLLGPNKLWPRLVTSVLLQICFKGFTEATIYWARSCQIGVAFGEVSRLLRLAGFFIIFIVSTWLNSLFHNFHKGSKTAVMPISLYSLYNIIIHYNTLYNCLYSL